MNTIETLPFEIECNDNLYGLNVHTTAWGKLCIGYYNVVSEKKSEYLCLVTIEPENEPCHIRDTKDCYNALIGNARSMDDAVEMLKDYIANDLVVTNVETL